MRSTALVSSLLLAAAAAFAQTSETIPFRAVLLPSNEVPAVNIAANGAATVWLHVVRDAQGRVTSASTTFDTRFDFPSAVRITGMHIHRGRAGENGPVTIDSGITGPTAVESTGAGTLLRQAFSSATAANALDTVNGMLSDPSGYYVNVHTTDFPAGAIRGQLMRADLLVLMGLMSPVNEVPPIPGLDARGTGSVIVVATRDSAGSINSAQVTFDLNYTGFPEGTAFTGFHIHNGAAGVNGPVTINTGVQGGANAVPAQTPGGNLRYVVEVPVANTAALLTLYALFENPGSQYINLHTAVSPGGAIRAQLRRTDKVQFQALLSPANEVPAIASLDAQAPASFTAHTLRDAEGRVVAGLVFFDASYRFPGTAQFTGMHIHNAAPGSNGPVTIDSGLQSRQPVESESGSGNIFRFATISIAPALEALNSVVQNPENHYLNLHTSANPGGAVRAQLAAASATRPTVSAVISSVSDPSLRTVARGGLMTVFGSNLVKVESDIGSAFDGERMPSGFNGTQVTIGGLVAPLVAATRSYIVAQVPLETPLGSQAVAVRNANGDAAGTLSVNVAAAAPAIYFDTEGAIVFDANFNRSGTAAAPASREGMFIVYSTGLGQPRAVNAGAPDLATGQVAPSSGALHRVNDVAVLLDGRPAPSSGTFAAPGFVGLYQTLFTVPEGVRSGPVTLQLRAGDALSNTLTFNVR